MEKGKVADYESHYSAKVDKCFIHIQDTSGTEPRWTSQTVFDAFEGKGYGVYVWHNDRAKKYWEVPPVECEVTQPSGDKRACHSDDEFTEMVKLYMEG